MPLTERQIRIARLVLRGFTNGQIADQLRKRFPGLTARTVREECNVMRDLWPDSPLPARQRIVRHYEEAK